jgi:hypothetical protein
MRLLPVITIGRINPFLSYSTRSMQSWRKP